MTECDIQFPKEIRAILTVLTDAGYEAYIVGGCVRDLLRGAMPNDWDVTTSAKPEEIQQLFPDSFYENKFLTVTVKTGAEDLTLKEIEITTFRTEGKYTDKRHPDEVQHASTLKEDLSRRDFTINAMAIKIKNANIENQHDNAKWKNFEVIDLFDGQQDLKNAIIQGVGDPNMRFKEDALRMMRAVRFATQLGFTIEEKTHRAIQTSAGLLEFIAKERIRDELIKIIATPHARKGVELLYEVGLLKYIIPELEEGIDAENRPKVFTIWEHNLKSLEYGAQQNFPFDVRLAALLHDVGKPRTRGPQKNNEWTFYGHDVVGGRMALHILQRLHFPKDQIQKIATLIRWHLFKYELDTDDASTTDAAIRRIIRRVGAENMADLVKLRICDRMGMGVPKPVPYRLRHFQFRVEKVLKDEEAPTPKMLVINGEDIMNALHVPPSRKIGAIIEVLLQEVIDEPSKNVRKVLLARVEQLGTLDEKALEEIAERAESKIELAEDERVSKIKAKYYIQ